MELITLRDKIRHVLAGWWSQYCDGKEWHIGYNQPGRSEQVYKELCALDLDHCSAEDVEAVIGNDTWTTLECYECGEVADKVVAFEVNHEYLFYLCAGCTHRAARLFL